MAVHKHTPVPEKDMAVQSARHTICEVLRQIYWKTTDLDIKKKCREATAMAKAMTRKLEEYKAGSSEELFESDLDVLMLTQHDWANTGYRFAQCLRLAGLKVFALKGESHPYGYPRQMTISSALRGLPMQLFHTVPALQGLAKQAKVLHFLTSTTFFPGPPDLKPFAGKKVVMQHGGTNYRKHHKTLNRVHNLFVDKTIIQCPDLLGLGAKNETLIYYPVDTDKIEPVYESEYPDRYVIGHFPRSEAVKGTKEIMAVLDGLKGKFNFEVRTGGLVPWEQNLDRMAGCDIIIETMQPELNGKRYGEWGNTALEAAALGKVVVTNCHSQDVYIKEYGTSLAEWITLANDPEYLRMQLTLLLSLRPSEMVHKKAMSRVWANDFHGMQATSKRLMEKVYGPLLDPDNGDVPATPERDSMTNGERGSGYGSDT